MKQCKDLNQSGPDHGEAPGESSARDFHKASDLAFKEPQAQNKIYIGVISEVAAHKRIKKAIV